MRFEVLGPLRVIAGDATIDIGGDAQGRLLAMLLVHVGENVGVSRLQMAVWDGEAPDNGRKQLQNRVARLRMALARAGRHDVIHTTSGGYLARVADADLDIAQLEAMIRQAATLHDQGRTAEAVVVLRSALALRRGPALAGLHGLTIEREAAALDEKWLSAANCYFGWEAQLGHHSAITPELSQLVAEFPLREGPVQHLMTALWSTGRRADALNAYHDLANRLDEELGLVPGVALQTLRDHIIRDEHPPVAARPLTSPCMLPAAVPDFVGRSDTIASLDKWSSPTDAAGGPGIAVLTGPGGMGKTALALHWSHRMKSRFPDGQLYLNLQGFSSTPAIRPVDAMARFLEALGVPQDRIPVDVDRCADLYRMLLSGRRVLVVLDNASDVDQVRPLLPGAPTCALLVTSRQKLTGLAAVDGAHHLPLVPLPSGEAQQLLGQILANYDQKPALPDLADLATACAGLPLALRIAAANLRNGRRHGSLRRTPISTSSGTESWLDYLAIPGDADTALRTSFSHSYRSLPDAGQALFRRLAAIPVPLICEESAAAVGDRPETTSVALQELAEAHLIENTAGSFQMHDLLRAYAEEQLHETEGAQQYDAARTRWLLWYLAKLNAATRAVIPDARLYAPEQPHHEEWPGFDDRSTAMAWLEQQRPNLVAATVAAAADDNAARFAWMIAGNLRSFIWLSRNAVDGVHIGAAALRAAQQHADALGIAVAADTLGLAYYCAGDRIKAAEHLDLAMAAAASTSDIELTATIHQHLSFIAIDQARYDDAADQLTKALAANCLAGNHRGQASNLANLATVHCQRGDLDSGLQCLQQVLQFAIRSGAEHRIAYAQGAIGLIHLDLGEPDAAAKLIHQALHTFRRLDDGYDTAVCLEHLAILSLDLGQIDDAYRYADEAVLVGRRDNGRSASSSQHRVLARVHAARGDHAAAITAAELALAIAEGAAEQPETLATLAASQAAFGDAEAALSNARKALAVSLHTNQYLRRCEIRLTLAKILMHHGDAIAARHEALAGGEDARETKRPLIEARLQLLLHDLDPDASGSPHLHAAAAALRHAHDKYPETAEIARRGVTPGPGAPPPTGQDPHCAPYAP